VQIEWRGGPVPASVKAASAQASPKPMKAEGADPVIRRADTALYSANKAGHNRVVAIGDITPA
jgi:GGDEF domain-containing protein